MTQLQEKAIARSADHENLVGELVEACELGLHYIEAVCFNTPNPKKRENYANAASKLRTVIAKAKAEAQQ